MKEELLEAGFSQREIEVYLHLIKSGETSANDVAKELGINRTVAYNTLNNLIEKGLVSHIIKKSRRMFIATDPENLLRPLKEKETLLAGIVTELKLIKQATPVTTAVEILEGKEGLKTVYELALKNRDITFYGMGVTGETIDIIQFAFPNIVKRFKSQNIKVKLIVNYDFRNKEFTKIPGVESRYLPKQYTNNATMSIFGEEVVIALGYKPIFIHIKNKDMAEGYKNYFKILWAAAKK